MKSKFILALALVGAPMLSAQDRQIEFGQNESVTATQLDQYQNEANGVDDTESQLNGIAFRCDAWPTQTPGETTFWISPNFYVARANAINSCVMVNGPQCAFLCRKVLI